MKKTKLLLLTLLIQLQAFSLFAQLELGFQGGKNFLEGDAHCWDDSKITPFTATGGTFGLFARYLFSDRQFGARLNYAYMPLKFDDRRFSTGAHTVRGFNGTNKASDISLDLAWHLFRKKKIHPYLFGGLGVQLAKYEIDFNEAKATPALKALIAKDKAASTTNFILPVGAGLEWRINPRVGLHWENSMRLPMSDLYDGISNSANTKKNDWYGYSVLGLNFLLQGDPDTDKDGISDKKDACPKVKGLKAFAGCPDTDGDGIKDSEDRCPTTSGLAKFKGCPDTDGDNVPNVDDECPDVKGSVNLKGCPDGDDDGVADRDDDCPTAKGATFLRGCPDSDGDNIADKDDACPTEKGTAAMRGCPDSDGDGIANKDDKCPNERGTAAMQGCPEVKPVEPVAVTTTNPTTTTTTTPTTVVTTTTTSQSSSSCAACNTSNDPIFTSIFTNPKKLSHLGSNPEFGNSHGLTPEGFYNKLKKAYKANKVDKEFLDRIYKAMGYSGFADARAEQFSAVIIPQGTSGKLGYSVLHKTGCYTLPDNEHDRMAFHIVAANGCDIHFMKTCGNHFFFCK